MAFFSDFQYGFRYSRSTADLPTVVSDRITRVFNRSGATQGVTLDISKAFDRVWHAGPLHKLKSYGVSGQIFGLFLLFSVIDDLKWFLMESLHKNIQLMLEFLRTSFLVLHFSCTFDNINDLSDDVICNIAMLMILLSILSVIRHLICGNNLNWLLNLNLIYKILLNQAGSDLLISMLEKLNWFCLTGLITLVLLM